MKKYFFLIIILFCTNLFAQTPPLKTRSNGTFTEVDQYLNVSKSLGIPTNTTDNVVSTGTPYKMIFNSTTGKLRIFNGISWINADGSTDDGFVSKVGNETVEGNKIFTGTTQIDYLYNSSPSDQRFFTFENSSYPGTVTELVNTDIGYQTLTLSTTTPYANYATLGSSEPGVSAGTGTRSFMLNPFNLFFNNDSKIVALVPNALQTISTINITLPKEPGTLVIEKYKIYVAGLTQSGTFAPTATINDNTLSDEIVWTRDSPGIYYGELTSAFISNNTRFFITSTDSHIDYSVVRIDNNTIRVETREAGTLTDNFLNDTTIEIRVYN